MAWLIFVLLSAVLSALINHVDKYLIGKYLTNTGIGSLVIFSSLMGLPVFLLIAFFVPEVFFINLKTAFFIILNGIIYISWLLPYFYALQNDEASVVAPLFQLAGIFSLIFGYLILGEVITFRQMTAGILILLGSIGLSLEFEKNSRINFKIKVYFLMALASALAAFSGVIFKYFAIEESFWVTSFWEFVGFFIAAGFLFVFIRPYRRQFTEVLKTNRFSIISINLFNEVMAVLAKILLNYASLLTAVALVFFVSEGFQPFFVLFFGVFLTLFFPKICREKLEKKYLIRKINSILLMFLGVFLLNY